MPGREAFPLSASRSLDGGTPAKAGEEVPVPGSHGLEDLRTRGAVDYVTA